MTTPGGQLTPGDETTPPVYGVPDGAYVGDAGSPNAISELSHMTEAKAKEAMRTPIGPSFIGQRDGFWGALNALLGLVQGGIDLVVGVVVGVVDGIKTIIGAIGSLFGMSSRDMSAVDAARVAGENAIVENMSDSLEHLDEIQRVGASFMNVPTFAVDNGENFPHHVPLTAMFPLSDGARMIPPTVPLTHSQGHRYPSVLSVPSETGALRPLAQGCGQMELLESGLWLIHFQVAALQGSGFTDRPVDAWCHVTAAESEWLPVGPPEVNIQTGAARPGELAARSRNTGVLSYRSASEQVAYGRAGSYVGDRNSDFSGGNTIPGLVLAYLEEGAWKVNLSCNSWQKYSGPMSTYVYATKVNSETLRQDIDQLKLDIADALPGQNVDLLLDEAAIGAMVSEAQGLEVPEVVVPDE